MKVVLETFAPPLIIRAYYSITGWLGFKINVKLINLSTAMPFQLLVFTLINGPLSPQHGASSGRAWRRRPPDMEGGCEYTEQSRAADKGLMLHRASDLDGSSGMDWIQLAQDRDQWRVLMNTVMSLRIP
jgi:hypothetical protein